MIMKTIVKGCVLALAVAGCGFEGPSPIVSASGMTAPAGAGTTAIFRGAFDASYANSTDSQAAARMVKVGAELSYQLCRDFFRSSGKEQQWLLFGKDFLAVAGTLTTGILGAVAVASGGAGNATAIAWTGLGTAAGVSTINLYARNFLFSEDNVGAVQTLTLDAVSAARSAAISDERLARYDFASGVSALIDVQAQCEVQNILTLVRKSLGLARPYAVSEIGAAAGSTVQARIGDLVNNRTAITTQQLQALYWLLMLSPTDAEKAELNKSLSSLFVAPTLTNGATNQSFTGMESEIRKALAVLQTNTPGVVDQIVKNVADARKAGSSGPAAAPGPPGAPGAAAASRLHLPPLQMPTGSSSLGPIRVEVAPGR
jgi:hypothetical protein